MGLDVSLPISGAQLREEVPHVNQVIVEDPFCFVEELENGAIAHRIKDALSFFPTFDDVALPQDGQLLGKRTLLNSQPGAQLIDTYFPISQSIKNLDPHRMGEGLEELGSER